MEGRPFCTAHTSQTVYHGPVVYAEDPSRRLERASSELERRLLPVFLKDAANRAQRESRFAVWAEKEPEEDRLDLEVSPALLDAMWKPRQKPEGSGFMPAGGDESSAVEERDDAGAPSARVRVEALPAFAGSRNPTIAARRYDREPLPGDLREAATTYATVEALRQAVDNVDGGGRACPRPRARRTDRAVPVFDLRRRHRRSARGRGRRHPAHGRTRGRRGGQGEHRGRAREHVRMLDKRRRCASGGYRA